MKSTKEIFDSWVGEWKISRRLGEYGTIEGVAKFSHDVGEQVLYREDLLLTYFSIISKPVYREYTYFYNNGEIEKKFHDQTNLNQKFYALIFDDLHLTATGKYICNQDAYLAYYNFFSKNQFSLSYKVEGPNKQYIITSSYIRVDQEEYANGLVKILGVVDLD